MSLRRLFLVFKAELALHLKMDRQQEPPRDDVVHEEQPFGS